MRKNHKRLGATPAAMTLGDVLAALQQGAIDGAIAAGTGRPGQPVEISQRPLTVKRSDCDGRHSRTGGFGRGCTST